MNHYPGGIKKLWMSYVGVLFFCLLSGALFDTLLVLPLVEIDDSLTILYRAEEGYHRLRRLLAVGITSTLFLVFLAVYLIPMIRFLRKPEGAPSEKVIHRILRAPQYLGFLGGQIYMEVFVIISVIDHFFLDFPVPGEGLLYSLTTFTAMLSTSLFLFMAVYLSVDLMNRKVMIPLFFPRGMVSQASGLKPITFTAKLILLWLAVGLYPMVVLGTGYLQGGFKEGMESQVLVFIGVMIPLGSLLVISTARSFQMPVKDLLSSADRIEKGNFDTELTSRTNDELGYLTDRFVLMAEGLSKTEQIKESFGRAVDPRVRDLLLDGEIRLGGERKKAAVLFCDIRGFTSYSENTEPERVLKELNYHLEEMETCVRKHGGMINKFLGDGFLALFGLPLPSENPALEALNAACEMLERNDDLNLRHRSDSRGSWNIGIGVHYGEVMAGNIGSQSRLEYTAMGDTVNTASRLQELSKRVDHQIFLTRQVYQAMEESKSRELPRTVYQGKVRFRGKQQVLEVWGI